MTVLPRVARRSLSTISFMSQSLGKDSRSSIECCGSAEELFDVGSDKFSRPDTPDVTAKAHPDQERQATVSSSIINLSNTILGTGMLSVPYAIATSGLFVGLIMLALSALASASSLWLLVECSNHVGFGASYYSCAKKTYKHMAFLINLVVFLKCFGVAISYLIVIGDVLPDVVRFAMPKDLDETSLLLQRQFWITLFGFIVVPLSFLKHLHSLRFTSLLALCTTFYIVCLLVFFGITSKPVPLEDLHWVRLDRNFFSVMTVFVFAFTCHQNIFSIYGELVDPSPSRINGVISISIGMSWVLYIIVGVVGYLSFGNAVSGNILANLPSDQIFVTIGRVLVAIHLSFSFPLQANPARICLDNIVVSLCSNVFGMEAGPQTTQRYIFETLLILFGTFAVGFTVSDLEVVLNTVGATGSVLICYILPGLFYAKLVPTEKCLSVRRWIADFLVVLGILVMAMSIYHTFIITAPRE